LAITAANGKNQKDGDDAPRRNCGHSHSKNVLYRDIRVEAINKTENEFLKLFHLKMNQVYRFVDQNIRQQKLTD
jgi:hypothetical protein